MLPVVFISHSSADNDRARALVQALEQTGRLKTTFDVAHLRQGQAYAPQLYQWMARAHGAVLLLTENVMRKPEWVLQEATVLRARSVLEGPAFRLFVLVDAPVLASEIWQRWFAPLNLDALQRLKVLDPDKLPDQAAPAIVDGMDGALDHDGDYLSLLAQAIADDLANPEPGLARVLERGLQIEDAAWTAIVGPQRDVTRLFARRLCGGDFGQFGGIDRLFNAIQLKSRRELRERLLGTLASYWVPLDAAARLADALAAMRALPPGAAPPAGEPPPNVVLIGTDYARPERVAALHRDRQFRPYDQLGHWLTVAAGEESAPALAAQVLAGLRALYPGEPAIDEATLLARHDQGLRAPHYPVFSFVHVPVSASAEHVLQCARRFAPCLFIVTAPPALFAELAAQPALAPLCAPSHPPPDGRPPVEHLRDIELAQGFACRPP